jgi:hypothetical protein
VKAAAPPRARPSSPAFAWAALAMVASAAAGCGDDLPAQHDDGGGGPPDGRPGPGPPDPPPGGFSVVVLPDTQYYSSNFPEIFEDQVRFIRERRDALRIAFMLHEGDIVDTDLERQWNNASRSLHQLDGLVPYVLAPGNHDYAGLDARSTMINRFFPLGPIAAQPWFLAAFEADKVENTAQLLALGDRVWLVIALEFGPRDAALAWADDLLKTHADLPAIIVTHAYLYHDGTRYDRVARPEQEFSPYAYFSGAPPPPGTVNDGEDMWRKLVEGNDNVGFVICGHVFNRATGDAAASLTSTRASGRRVHQVVANYQETANGGDGFLRVMQFIPDPGEVRVFTYSPTLNRFKSDQANQFVLPLP